MNRKSVPGLLHLGYRSLTILAVASLFVNAAHAGTCDATIANLVSWLDQDPHHGVTATIASNRPPASQPASNGTESQVTYSKIELKKSAWIAGLYSPAADKLYYNQPLWSPLGLNLPVGLYPFDPNAAKTVGIVISGTGTVVVSPDNAAQSFVATCSGGVMFGQPAVSGIVAQFPPMYTITFYKWTETVPK